jgi:hypothetical protein
MTQTIAALPVGSYQLTITTITDDRDILPGDYGISYAIMNGATTVASQTFTYSQTG